MEDAGEKAKNAEGDVDEQGAAAPVHDEDGEGGEEEGGDQGDQVPSFIPAATLTFARARAHLFSFLMYMFFQLRRQLSDCVLLAIMFATSDPITTYGSMRICRDNSQS